MLDNKLGITSSPMLAEAEEKISKQNAIRLFEEGILDTVEAGTFKSLQTIHFHLFDEMTYIFPLMLPLDPYINQFLAIHPNMEVYVLLF